MFGEDPSESPRLPSPWLSRSSAGTPSPLSLPSTPQEALPPSRARRPSSLEDLGLFGALGDDLDSLSPNKGKLGTSPRTEEIAWVNGKLEGLQPEVDHKGHIEYKLKLLKPTSIHRLEKLRTQLRWRLTQGGGVAMYELGLLDNGEIVGLNQQEMDESLQTLGQMLAGLGGGQVQVTRVMRIGGVGVANEAALPNELLFPSFDVLPSSSDRDFIARCAVASPSDTPPLFPPEKDRGPTPFPTNRTPEEQAVFRRDKRDQRRARRAALQGVSPFPLPPLSATTPATSSPASSSTVSPPSPATPPALSAPIPIQLPSASSFPPSRLKSFYPSRPKPPKPTKPPRDRRRTTASSPAPSSAAAKKPQGSAGAAAPVKPGDARADPAEVRYVVEAVVIKGFVPPVPSAGSGEEGLPAAAAAAGVGKRRKSSVARSPPSPLGRVGEEDLGDLSEGALTSTTTEDDERTEESEEEQDEEEPDLDLEGEEEGWTYLEFDLAELSSSAKAAAAASAGAGAVRA